MFFVVRTFSIQHSEIEYTMYMCMSIDRLDAQSFLIKAKHTCRMKYIEYIE